MDRYHLRAERRFAPFFLTWFLGTGKVDFVALKKRAEAPAWT